MYLYTKKSAMEHEVKKGKIDIHAEHSGVSVDEYKMALGELDDVEAVFATGVKDGPSGSRKRKKPPVDLTKEEEEDTVIKVTTLKHYFLKFLNFGKISDF